MVRTAPEWPRMAYMDLVFLSILNMWPLEEPASSFISQLRDYSGNYSVLS